MGVGICPGKGPDKWKVAFRAWSEQDLEQKVLKRELNQLGQEAQVRITGPIRASSTPLPIPISDTRRQRPLVPGCSIGHFKVSAGTLGAFVRDADGKVYALSNNHVLANVNAASVGDLILQPAAGDGGTLAADKVGSLRAFHPLEDKGNLVDAALAEIDPQLLPADYSIPGIGKVQGTFPGFSKRPGVPAGAGPVQKVGRSTGHTHGKITALGLRDFPAMFGNRTLRFDNVAEVEGTGAQPFSAPGDSGSLVVNADGYAVGLLFAGNEPSPTNPPSSYIHPH